MKSIPNQGRLEAAEALVERGAAMDSRNKKELGRTPLHTAAENGRLNIIRFLIEKNQPMVNMMDLESGSTALHLACQFGQAEAVRILCTGGADRESRDMYGDRPIHRAAAAGHHEALYELLSFNINPDAVDARGRTALIIAAAEGHTAAVEMLLRCGGADVEMRDDDHGFMAIHHASVQGHAEIVKLLVGKEPSQVNRITDAKKAKGRMPLHLAILHGRVSVAEYLLSLGAVCDSQRKDTAGKTPYMLWKSDLTDNKDISEEIKTEMSKVLRKYNVR